MYNLQVDTDAVAGTGCMATFKGIQHIQCIGNSEQLYSLYTWNFYFTILDS